MKFKMYNAVNSVRTTPTKGIDPIIGIGIKNGLFGVNAKALETMGLSTGDTIEFVQDEEKLTNWYAVKGGADGFLLREKKNSKGLFFNNTTVANSLAESGKQTGNKSFKLSVKAEALDFDGKQFWPLEFIQPKK